MSVFGNNPANLPTSCFDLTEQLRRLGLAPHMSRVCRTRTHRNLPQMKELPTRRWPEEPVGRKPNPPNVNQSGGSCNIFRCVSSFLDVQSASGAEQGCRYQLLSGGCCVFVLQMKSDALFLCLTTNLLVLLLITSLCLKTLCPPGHVIAGIAPTTPQSSSTLPIKGCCSRDFSLLNFMSKPSEAPAAVRTDEQNLRSI